MTSSPFSPSPATPPATPTTHARAAVVIIGDEILNGRTADKNIHTLAAFLTDHGIDLWEVRVIRDDVDGIAATVNLLRRQVDIVICTGGIGPTHDDKTAQAIANAFDRPLQVNPQALASLQTFYTNQNKALNAGRRKMAAVPAGATLIANPLTIAPGFMVDNVVVLAGVPSIMQGMLADVARHLPAGTPRVRLTLRCDLPESLMADTLAQLERDHPRVTVGSYPKDPSDRIQVDVVLHGTDHDSLAKACQDAQDRLSALGGHPERLTD